METTQLKTHTISECLGFPEGTPIPRVIGMVKQIWDIKRGEKDGKAWSIQSGVLANGNDSIKFTLSGCPVFPYSQGQKVVFRSNKGSRGLTGVKIKIDTYKDKNEPMIWLTPTGMILLEDEESDDIPYDYEEGHGMSGKDNPAKAPEQPKTAPKANVATKKPDLDEALRAFKDSKPDPKKGIQEVKQRVMQYANLREITDHAAAFLYQDQQTGMVEKGIIEKIKDVSSCFFIQGIRDGLHLKLPNNKPLSKKEEAGASETEMSEEDIKF